MTRPHNGFATVLHPWAAKLTLRSHLSKITLSHILAGDTCDPISLSDLECYLAYREHSLENLQFVVWFQDYRKRFFALPPSEQALSPPPDGVDLSFPPTSRYPVGHDSPLSHQILPVLDISSFADIALTPIIPFPERTLQSTSPKKALAAAADPVPLSTSTSRKDSVSRPQHSPTLVSPSKATLPGIGFTNQPFKKECMRIIATFLRPGALKELPLDDALRFDTIKALAYSTHPDVFFPVYHEMYNKLEKTSVPGFLAYSSAHINLPQQIFWCTSGLTYILIGIGISLSLILTVPVPPQSRRAWRLFGSIFVGCGIAQLYSSFRGFCSRLYLKGRMQLRVWELQDVDEKAKTFWTNILDPEEEKSGRDLLQEWDPVSEDYKVIDDVGSDPDPIRPSLSSSSSIPNDLLRQRHPLVPLYAARNGFNRPPVFGPDKVVQDPRIKAHHRQVMIELLLVGFVSTAVFAAIIIPIPSLNR